MSVQKLGMTLGFAALFLGACSDSEDTSAPTIKKGEAVLVSPFDTVTVQFSEGVKELKKEQVVLSEGLQFKSKGDDKILVFGTDALLGNTDPKEAPVFYQMKANQDFTIEIKDLVDGEGNRTPFDTLKFSTLPLVDSKTNDKLSSPDTLALNGQFTIDPIRENTIKVAGFLQRNLMTTSDSRDFYGLELKLDSKIKISLTDYSDDLILVFQGPVYPGLPLDSIVRPFWSEPKVLDTKTYPANLQSIKTGKSDSVSIEETIDPNRHSIGVVEEDPFSVPLMYWVEVAFANEEDREVLQTSPYELEITIER